MRSITAHYGDKTTPKSQAPSFCVGAGRAHEMLRAVPQQQLRLAHEECGFRYLRFHGLLCDEMAVYRENEQGEPIYNFLYIDHCMDGVLAAGVKPFVELSFTPDAMKSGDKTLFWWHANVTPPNLGKWTGLIGALCRHWLDRYGEEELHIWYFEVRNDPNWPPFFTGTQSDYFALYDATAKVIKAIDPALRVGGPATCANAWIPEMIRHCHEGGIPLDFISTHAYGVDGVLDEDGKQQLWLNKKPDNLADQIIGSRRQIEQSPMPGLELHYTEWSASYSSRDCIHDSFFEASYILHTLKKAESSATSMSYWTYTDVFEELCPPPSPFHGGFGLMNAQGARKPAWLAYSLLHRLPKDVLPTEDGESWVAKDENGVAALLWDFRIPQQDACNNVYFTHELHPAALSPVRFSVDGLPCGTYRRTIVRVGAGSNDAYQTYYDQGRPQTPTRQQEEAIRNSALGAPESEKELVIDGAYSEDIPLREHDVVAVFLTRIV